MRVRVCTCMRVLSVCARVCLLKAAAQQSFEDWPGEWSDGCCRTKFLEPQGTFTVAGGLWVPYHSCHRGSPYTGDQSGRTVHCPPGTPTGSNALAAHAPEGHGWPQPALTMASLGPLPSSLEPPVSCADAADSGRPDALRAGGPLVTGGIPRPSQDSGEHRLPDWPPGHLQPQSRRGKRSLFWAPRCGGRGSVRSFLRSTASGCSEVSCLVMQDEAHGPLSCEGCVPGPRGKGAPLAGQRRSPNQGG